MCKNFINISHLTYSLSYFSLSLKEEILRTKVLRMTGVVSQGSKFFGFKSKDGKNLSTVSFCSYSEESPTFYSHIFIVWAIHESFYFLTFKIRSSLGLKSLRMARNVKM